MLQYGLVLPGPRFTLAAMLDIVRKFFGATSGLSALDWVQEPEGLRFPPGPRTRRMIRAAQLSSW